MSTGTPEFFYLPSPSNSPWDMHASERKRVRSLYRVSQSVAPWRWGLRTLCHVLLAMSARPSCLLSHLALMGHTWCLLPLVSLCIYISICLIIASPVINVAFLVSLFPSLFLSFHFVSLWSCLFPVPACLNIIIIFSFCPKTLSHFVLNDWIPQLPTAFTWNILLCLSICMLSPAPVLLLMSEPLLQRWLVDNPLINLLSKSDLREPEVEEWAKEAASMWVTPPHVRSFWAYLHELWNAPVDPSGVTGLQSGLVCWLSTVRCLKAHRKFVCWLLEVCGRFACWLPEAPHRLQVPEVETEEVGWTHPRLVLLGLVLPVSSPREIATTLPAPDPR